MPRKDRIELIKNIEKERRSKVICYITGDRPNFSTKIADDVTRILYSHLEAIGTQNQIDMVIYSRGGDLMTPFRMVHLIKEYCKTFCVIVPYRAHSAATLICLGANEIVMGKLGELSSVDPSTDHPFNPRDPTNPQVRTPISVEDVTSYLALARDEKVINNERDMIEIYRFLADKVHPLALGNVNRGLKLIRMIAPKLLCLHMDSKKNKNKINNIIDTLTRELYAHDYLISRIEAKKIGLNIRMPNKNLESLMWSLYETYEQDLQLHEPFNPNTLLGREPSATFSCDGAYVESVSRLDSFTFEGTINRIPSAPGAPPGAPSVAVEFTLKKWREIK